MYLPTGYYPIGRAVARLLAAARGGDVHSNVGCLGVAIGIATTEEEAKQQIGVVLASNSLRAAGLIPHTGELVSIPVEFWRTPAAKAVMQYGYNPELTFLKGSYWTDVVFLIAEPDFRVCFGCKSPFFSTPTTWPDEWGTTSPFAVESEGSVRASDHDIVSPPAEPTTPTKPAVAAGGRPTKYDLGAFRKEAVRAANDDGFESRRAMSDHMRDWVAKNWSDQPDERTLQRYLAELYPDELPKG